MTQPEQVRRVLWVTLGLNLGVAAAKLAYGLGTGVLSIAADGIHSTLDAGSNVVGLIAVSAASKPPDAEHPYGHRKFETFAALAIGILLVLACWEILRASWERLVHGGEPEPGPIALAIMLTTAVINLGVSKWERREGERLKSEILLADSAHTGSDVLVSLSVVAALVATMLGWGHADVVASVFIVGWIGRLSWKIVRPAVETLADSARVDAAAVDAIAMSVTGVRDVHRIRTRGHADAVFLDLHVQVDPQATVERAHEIAHEVEESIRERFPSVVDVITHLEPHGDPVEDLDGSIVGPPRNGP